MTSPCVAEHTEAHTAFTNHADAETAEGDDDIQAHGISSNRADAETAEGDDDTEGHAGQVNHW